MRRSLFWKLFVILVAGTIALFAIIQWLILHTEEKMSFLSAEHQNQLRTMARHAETLYMNGQHEALNSWLLEQQSIEDTWIAVVQSNLKLLAGSHMDSSFTNDFTLGRGIDWMIHLYKPYNPVMDIPFNDGQTHFLIRLPDRMRPGTFWLPIQLLLQAVLPFAVMALVCLLLYRHLISPIQKLEKATQKLINGDYSVRVSGTLGQREDELASLAHTFDTMAERSGNLILSQKRLLADFSHELRTPLTRIELAIDYIVQNSSVENLERIRREAMRMRSLAEDALTLSWLDTENPNIAYEPLDLVDLIESIIDDAQFEFPTRNIKSELPDNALLKHSCSRLLGQALENIIRNALIHTPDKGTVQVTLLSLQKYHCLRIDDQGPGVPEQELENIFLPFYRVIRPARHDTGGFGLGLALAKRQLGIVNGQIRASNLRPAGLRIEVCLYH